MNIFRYKDVAQCSFYCCHKIDHYHCCKRLFVYFDTCDLLFNIKAWKFTNYIRRNVTEVKKYESVNLVVTFSSILEYLILSLAYSKGTKTWNKHDKHFISIVLSYCKKSYVFLALFLWWYIKVLITYLVEIKIFFIKILSNKIIF